MAGAGNIRHSNDLPRGFWRWGPGDDARLREMKRGGARHKVIARELGRSPASIDGRVLILKAAREKQPA